MRAPTGSQGSQKGSSVCQPPEARRGHEDLLYWLEAALAGDTTVTVEAASPAGAKVEEELLAVGADVLHAVDAVHRAPAWLRIWNLSVEVPLRAARGAGRRRGGHRGGRGHRRPTAAQRGRPDPARRGAHRPGHARAGRRHRDPAAAGPPPPARSAGPDHARRRPGAVRRVACRGARVPAQGRRQGRDPPCRAGRRRGGGRLRRRGGAPHRGVLHRRPATLCRPGVPRADRPRAGGTRPGRRRVRQPRDRSAAGAVGEDRPQPRRGHPAQARGLRPRRRRGQGPRRRPRQQL
jgi:hypothetical protein